MDLCLGGAVALFAFLAGQMIGYSLGHAAGRADAAEEGRAGKC